MRIHKKWEQLHHEIDLRQHQHTLSKLGKSKANNSSKHTQSRAMQRIYQPGGTLEKSMRKIYREGLLKLNTNSFENQAAKEDWQNFVAQLLPEELSAMTDEHWV
jgi:hypothetical protein